MNRPVLTSVAALALLIPAWGLLTGCSKDKKKSPGCTKDTDCKGDRVCEKGTCVAASEVPAKGPLGKAPDASGAAPGAGSAPGSSPGAAPGQGAPTPPGGGFLTPGGPGGPGAGGAGPAGFPPIKICVGKQCVTMGADFGKNPADMGQLFDLARQLIMDGIGAPPGGGTRAKAKIEICVGTQCVTLDDDLMKNPGALLKLFSQLGPGFLQQLLKQGFGPGGLFGGPHKRRGLPPGQRGQPGQPQQPTPPGTPPSPGAQPPSATPSSGAPALLRDYASITQAGANAPGQEAELSGLTVTSVSDDRVVLEGPDKEMIVLKITAARRDQVNRLRMTTDKVTLRFQILSPPVGKILHGELVTMRSGR